MKTKPVPAIVMLIAGFVTCIMAIYTHMELAAFTKRLLLVLIVFYIFGVIIKIILDKNFAEMAEEEPEEETDSQEPEEEEQAEEPKTPEEEQAENVEV